ncbi:MAG: hypothetical protein GY746_01795 [Gammaproteobacteria bacterium]|nr:hypothetical protein [Gammaproteobacteria bacterium]
MAFSIILAITIVACKKDSTIAPQTVEEQRPPDFGTLGSSITAIMFKSIGDGAMGEIGEVGISWALSSLSLAESSPDSTQQLDNIKEDLQVIIGQLTEIEEDLSEIVQELTMINCNEWASTLSYETGRIDHLLMYYNFILATASNGGIVSQATIADWVDQVLAQGNYSNYTPLDEILDEIADKLYVPPSSGVIPACVQILTAPENKSFGTDTIYYNQVKMFTDYYYSYQLMGLSFLNEAYHYQAWKAAGEPNSTSYSADSIGIVCSDPDGEVMCTDAAVWTNTVYNSLLEQLTLAGEPHTDDNFLMEYDATDPKLWVKSLEHFTIAAGDNCSDPLTSGNPCGVLATLYSSPSPLSVTYRGYKFWEWAGLNAWNNLLSDWTGGTIGDYLENSLGFKNMKNKIFIDYNTVKIELVHSHHHNTVVPFFDTDIDKYAGGGDYQPFQDTDGFNYIVQTVKKNDKSKCSNFSLYKYTYSKNPDLPASRNDFYDIDAVIYFQFGSVVCDDFNMKNAPGWLANNTGNSAIGYHFVRASLTDNASFECTEGRSQKNTGGVWTKCGDDFTAFLEANIPRPSTCDDPSIKPACSMDKATIAGAKKIFNNNTL